MLACFDVPSTIPIGLAACDGFFEPREKTKYLDEDTLGLEALQPIEIPQNGQSFLWKCLEKNSRDLEKLGEMLGGGGAPPEPHFAALRLATFRLQIRCTQELS